MLILENIKLAFSALFSNKMRSLLTMLGIIIGIGSVIAIMTVSSSLTTSISTSFQEMGANNITVGIKQSTEEEEVRSNGMVFGTSGRTVTADEDDMITDDMLEELQDTFSDQIDAIAISESVGSATIDSGSSSSNISLTGINPDYFESSEITLLAGRKIKQEDLDGTKKVIMVSDKVIETFFDGDNESALAQAVNVTLNNVTTKYYIVGVYEYEEDSTFTSDSDEDVETSAYIPITTGKEQLHSDDGYSQFTIVTATSVDSVSTFASQVEAFFAPYYADNEDYEISTSTMESMTESMNEMIQTVSIAIAFIAGISLLVGGIGVMNIMLVSITERTREIGTRKALGAKNSSIRLQFIIESIILCLIGGLLGILTGFLLGAIAASILGYSATAPVGAILLSVGFSMIIGTFFGYYPANKAAKLDPIEALRYE
ncbi:MAG: ABC transporter permease [Clostridiaceae bacterium]|nr:ABC transporter permease [Clostridiaceae bacterium]